jgi:hypothetical protein
MIYRAGIGIINYHKLCKKRTASVPDVFQVELLKVAIGTDPGSLRTTST